MALSHQLPLLHPFHARSPGCSSWRRSPTFRISLIMSSSLLKSRELFPLWIRRFGATRILTPRKTRLPGRITTTARVGTSAVIPARTGLTLLQLDSKLICEAFSWSRELEKAEEERLDDEYAAVSQGELVYDQHRVTLSTSLTREDQRANTVTRRALSRMNCFTISEHRPKGRGRQDRHRHRPERSGNIITGLWSWNYKPSERVTINAGLHALTLTTNKTYSIEPRASVKWISALARRSASVTVCTDKSSRWVFTTRNTPRRNLYRTEQGSWLHEITSLRLGLRSLP